LKNFKYIHLFKNILLIVLAFLLIPIPNGNDFKIHLKSNKKSSKLEISALENNQNFYNIENCESESEENFDYLFFHSNFYNSLKIVLNIHHANNKILSFKSTACLYKLFCCLKIDFLN
jgi:hypothetical protein